MPYEIYKIIHLTGIVLTYLALGGVAVHAINGGTKADNKGRKLLAMTHGTGLLLALVGGFGLLARLGIKFPWDGWVFVKLGIWLVLGGVFSVFLRKPQVSKPLWGILILLFVLAAYLANYKPF